MAWARWVAYIHVPRRQAVTMALILHICPAGAGSNLEQPMDSPGARDHGLCDGDWGSRFWHCLGLIWLISLYALKQGSGTGPVCVSFVT